jgi:two-component system phosphate regulon response regulator PhoB
MMKRLRVLLVDDDPEVLNLVSMALEPALECRGAPSGEKALEALWSFSPDAMVLDLNLPGFKGDALLNLIRQDPRVSALPILVLTADTNEKTLLRVFDKGADDVLTKPFSPLELAARIRALLRRRGGQGSQDVFQAGPFQLTLSTHQVQVDGREVQLTPSEFSILQILLQQAGKVVSKRRMVEVLWGSEEGLETRTVDTHLANLRKKLGKAAGRIETVREFGIRLKP